VNKANGVANRIDDVNRAAISDVNSETNSALIRNQSVAILETIIFLSHCPHDLDMFPVDLLRSHKRDPSETMFAADFPMDVVKPRQRFRFIVRHLDARHT
jgi:hypothetical protein